LIGRLNIFTDLPIFAIERNLNIVKRIACYHLFRRSEP